jgi:hypothetical protein
MRKIIRPNVVCDVKTGLIPVGRTKFHEDFILHDEDDPFIPALDPPIRRLRLVDLGERSRGLLSDDIERVIAEIAASPHRPFRILKSKSNGDAERKASKR